MKTLIIRPGGDHSVQDVAKDYPSINNALCVDMVQVIMAGGVSFYLDEEGKYTGQVTNPHAQRFFESLGGRLFAGDYLVGPVAVLGPPDDDGYDTDVPDEIVQRFFEMVNG